MHAGESVGNVQRHVYLYHVRGEGSMSQVDCKEQLFRQSRLVITTSRRRGSEQVRGEVLADLT